tara:strand:+ start:1026 stop:1160 length:135 start_codon:yes stop_codon:yes gene_type:complete
MEEENNSLWPFAAAFVLYRLYKSKKKNIHNNNVLEDNFYYYEEE